MPEKKAMNNGLLLSSSEGWRAAGPIGGQTFPQAWKERLCRTDRPLRGRGTNNHVYSPLHFTHLKGTFTRGVRARVCVCWGGVACFYVLVGISTMTGISKSFAETLWRQTDLWRKMVLWGPYGDKLFCGDLVKTDCFFSPTFLLKSAKKKGCFWFLRVRLLWGLGVA